MKKLIWLLLLAGCAVEAEKREAEAALRVEEEAAEKERIRRAKTREFKDITGAFKVEAVFLSFNSGTVKIERIDNGKVVELEFERFCKEDQAWIKGRGWEVGSGEKP